MKKINIIAIFTIAIVAIASGCGASVSTKDEVVKTENKTTFSKETVKRGTQVGELAPKFELTKTNGEKVSLENLKGNPAVLVFWSAYCVSCEEEAPHINKLARDFESKNVKVIGINIGESEARTQGGIKDFGIEYEVARDEGRKITQKYKVLGTPTIVFLDKDGVIKYNGNELPKDYSERLNKLVS